MTTNKRIFVMILGICSCLSGEQNPSADTKEEVILDDLKRSTWLTKNDVAYLQQAIAASTTRTLDDKAASIVGELTQYIRENLTPEAQTAFLAYGRDLRTANLSAFDYDEKLAEFRRVYRASSWKNYAAERRALIERLPEQTEELVPRTVPETEGPGPEYETDGEYETDSCNCGCGCGCCETDSDSGDSSSSTSDGSDSSDDSSSSTSTSGDCEEFEPGKGCLDPPNPCEQKAAECTDQLEEQTEICDEPCPDGSDPGSCCADKIDQDIKDCWKNCGDDPPDDDYGECCGEPPSK